MNIQQSGNRFERQEQILQEIRSQISELLGFNDSEQLDVNASLLEIGADSITVMQAITKIKDNYGVQISIRQFFEELTTLNALADYITQNVVLDNQKYTKQTSAPSPQPLPQQKYPQADQPRLSHNPLPTLQTRQEASSVSRFQPLKGTSKGTSDNPLSQVMHKQLEVMSQQLALLQMTGRPLGYSGDESSSNVAPLTPEARVATQTTQPGQSNGKISNSQAKNSLVVSAQPANHSPVSAQPANQTPTKKSATPTVTSPAELRRPPIRGLNEQQQAHLKALSDRYIQRTKTSKQQVQTYRPLLADSRASVGFRPSTKEMLYPLVADRSQGAYVWDVDGNKYVDLTMGQGVLLFGHQPDFIMEALHQQMDLGLQLHPRHHLVGAVAELICELTGVERVCFTNSGTEAVMTAIRLARAATGRDKIAIFSGAYHGHGDSSLIRREESKGRWRSVGMSAGIPAGVAADVVVLDYDSPTAIDFLRTQGHELAAVLVEPVQSNKPKLQPRQFLQQLRQVTQEVGTLLVLDEIITGFRSHPGGIQALFGVQADIVTYGKVVGGGMPIGIVAGRAQYLDHIDGGMWNYGDNSFPQVERTFFGGTFCMHPLAMAAAYAVLQHLKEAGSSLQESLNQKVANLATTLNNFFQEEEVPIGVEYFSSFFIFTFTLNLDPFFAHLVEKGVYVWEWRKCFISTAHSDADLEFIIQSVKETIWEMRAGGFFQKKTEPVLKAQTTRDIPPQTSTSQPSAIASVPVMAKEGSSKPGLWQKSTTTPVNQTGNQPNLANLTAAGQVQFSLFYFGNYNSEYASDKYHLLFEGVCFADQNDFSAVWLPERHFHRFGGFSPDPALLCAALAQATQNTQLRAGSVVLPLHHPVRVAEQWSVVDNLSQGRVGIAFASGWHVNDFVLAPEAFGNHRELTFQNIEVVQRLWRGEAVQLPNGRGEPVEVNIFPRPMQTELPIWLTIVSNPDTYRQAGSMGAGVLTNLMTQSIDTLAQNIQIYRQALVEQGYTSNHGKVTVLLHTFITESDLDQARQQARQPMCDYMTASVNLFKNMLKNQGLASDLDEMSDDDRAFILEKGYNRYVENSALIGTPQSCKVIVDRLMAIGVDEIACLIDFGIEDDLVIQNLSNINTLRQYYEELDKGAASQSATSQQIEVPLTQAQKQLWLLEQLGQNAALAYIDSACLEVHGLLQIDVMQQVLQVLIERHTALRTRILPDGQMQEILPSVSLELPIIDFSSFTGLAQTHKLNAWIDETFRQPFELSQAPLFQVYLLKLAEQRHQLVFKTHHILIDGWSLGVIVKEMGSLYSAYCQNQLHKLQVPMQFGEYVAWQTQQLDTEAWSAQKQYWLKQFAGSVPILNLPTDRPRPGMMSHQSGQQRYTIKASLAQAIKRLGNKQGCTLLMTLLGAYKVLLSRLSGDREIVVGIPTTGRSLVGSESLVAYCTHLLPIRSEINPDLTFAEYLKSLRSNLLDAYDHPDYPFADLIDQLGLKRDLSRPVLLSTTFNLDAPWDLPDIEGLEITRLPSPKIPALYDIHLNVTEVAGEFLLDCSYNLDILDGSTIQRWLHHFEVLLGTIATDPHQKVSQLALLNDHERQQILQQCQGEALELPPLTLHQLFEAQVEQTPEAIAVVFEEQKLSYRELNERANQLAHHLRHLGVEPDVLVGICVERSLEMLVGLLGILKAGGAYVPIDPSYPEARLHFILEDTQLPILITCGQFQSKLSTPQRQVVDLDVDQEVISQQPYNNLPCHTTDQHLAYVIYTSGSTGTPKGVLLEHRQVTRLFAATEPWYQFNCRDVWTLFHAFTFDFSVWELWGALLYGGRLIIVPFWVSRAPEAFYNLLIQENVTVLNQTPSAFQQLMNFAVTSNKTHPFKLRWIIFGGEALQPASLKPWCDHYGTHHPQLVNMYGITETTVHVTYCPLQVTDLNQSTSKIGTAIPDLQVYVLDREKQPVPIGVPGELYVGGAGVARGYLNRPELTAERFMANPFGEGRLYKTGDLARYLPDGNIEYLGRIDHQVKIRGFRIELGEIEAILTQYSLVKQAITIVHEFADGDQRLVAYFVSQDNVPLQTQVLRQYLQERLPAYMLPSLFVPLEALPLTANGKVARKALPDPTYSLQNEETYIAPRHPVEGILVWLWQQLLEIEPIGVNDDFLGLGGHSLKATQMISRVNQIFGVNWSIKIVFEVPTLGQLASKLLEEPHVLGGMVQIEQFCAQLEQSETLSLAD
ncbi:MAG: amino acid adenylation domain-containing protein, partial [Symploca sp. SIO1B1]|nr:amino acid adenylation domain-containing protein [Symploca sp. SIO1B1]